MPPDAALIIVNPTAGGGRARRLLPFLTEAAAEGGLRIAVTTRRGEAELLAASTTTTRVVAVGGDGTVQEVINGLAANDTAVTLGIIPAGGGNDLARALGLPRDPRRALAIGLGAGERLIDVAEATDAGGRVRRFAAAGGTGFDAQVAHAMARPRPLWQPGRVGYLLATLDELRRQHNSKLQITWDDGDRHRHRADLTSLFVAFANGAYYGGGMRIAPAAELDDGLLDLCIVGDISRLAALRQIPGIYRGQHVHHPAVRMARAHRLRIEGDQAAVHLDGEPFGHLPLDVVVRPKSLRVAAAQLTPARAESRR